MRVADVGREEFEEAHRRALAGGGDKGRDEFAHSYDRSNATMSHARSVTREAVIALHRKIWPLTYRPLHAQDVVEPQG